MPKTADKRAQARRDARIQRAHTSTPERAIVRRIPPAKRRRGKRTGLAATIQNYPWATLIFCALLIGLIVGIGASQHLGPWAKAEAKAHPTAVVPKCNLATHICAQPTMTITATKSYTATVKTTKGDFVITLDAKDTPATVNNFVYLADQGYYNDTYFWRAVKPGGQDPVDSTHQPSPLSLIQGGSVKADGSDANNPPGPPGYSFKDEKVVGDYTAGAVAMANHGANTNGAQFFVCTGDETKLINKNYTIFGHVTSGLSVAQSIQASDKILSVTIAVQ
ncbi:MAG TPA: peptidylprolyl isomerase [Ktedonobacterales bacterium]|nr:peptidylprolyl isomerase [Ktedonobacterales bacterium]